MIARRAAARGLALAAVIAACAPAAAPEGMGGVTPAATRTIVLPPPAPDSLAALVGAYEDCL